MMIATLALIFFGFAWGFASGKKNVFPAAIISKFEEQDFSKSAEKSELPENFSEISAQCRQASFPISDQFGNNHDPVYLPGVKGSEYNNYLIISGVDGVRQLYGANSLSNNPNNWKLVNENLKISEDYELDDGIMVNGIYYIFENGNIYEVDVPLENSSGKWNVVGHFPKELDDIGVYYDGSILHIFGEYGEYSGGYDGARLAYATSDLTFKNWNIVSTNILDPNTKPESNWGVGDPSLIVLGGRVIMITDIEGPGDPYRIALWESDGFGRNFNFAGILAAPAPGNAGYNNYRVQDGDFAVSADGQIYMFANWMDTDGNPGHKLPLFSEGWTRVVGGYHCAIDVRVAAGP
ncbi:hypothetical protein [Aurantiacibacter suaedae]|uniref:hypothetical protein n=1 Tax=Aurantiacibacter suaedae TaxID=2545755 RepID=UPI0010F64451|nr:hypothetical protein [Aurantiacibacter suaedae]